MTNENEDEKNEAVFFFAFISGIAIGAIFSAMVFVAITNSMWKKEACQKGYASYTCNPISGVQKWDWKTIDEIRKAKNDESK